MVQMNLFTRQKQSHRHRKQAYDYQRGSRGMWGEVNQEFEINMHTLLYINQVDNKDQLHSAGNYTQYLAMIYNGKESERIYSLSKSHVQFFGTPGCVACQASLKGGSQRAGHSSGTNITSLLLCSFLANLEKDVNALSVLQ